MSKHNNNLSPSASAICKCNRRMTIGEEHAGVSHINYECPDCISRKYKKPLTREEYYKQFNLS
jgi:hypothetical protein